jgi:glycerol-3-phosphate dehydrogenase (NAD(P)+)
MRITIVGAGAFGRGLGKILVDNGHEVAFFDSKVLQPTFEETVANAEVLVIAIPSEVVPKFASSLTAKLRGLPVILASKGLMSLEPFRDFERFSVLAGAAFAEDIMKELPVIFTVTDELAVKLFENERVKVELSDDTLGVMLCGSLKNVYAIGAGALVKAQSETPEYLEEALSEMKQYLKNHGANPETVDLSCGAGDLIMTATDEKSRNLRFGKGLREGQNAEDLRRKLGTIEGLSAIEQVNKEGYPIISKIYELVHGL